jgi:hypothetical protein
VRFLTELALLAVLAVVGANLGIGVAWSVGLALAGPLIVGMVWSVLIAPAARRLLPDPARLLVEIVLFGASAAGLAAVGHVVWATAFAAVGIGAAILVRLVSPGP